MQEVAERSTLTTTGPGSPPQRLPIKIIKDSIQDVSGKPALLQPRMRLLRTAFLPLNLYLCIDVPLSGKEDDPEASNEVLSIHLAHPPDDGKLRLVGVAGLPPPVRPATARPRLRRILVLLSYPGAPDGRYRVSLVRRGRHLGFAEVAKRTEHVRVLTKPQPPAEPHHVAPTLISGTPKSGTTWLEKIINAHPDFLVLHEANMLRMLDQDVLSQQLEGQREFYRSRFIPWMPVEYDAPDLARFLQISLAKELMAQMGRAWGARFVADRTPGYASLYPYFPEFWEELRVVHIVRHPLDVITSWLFHEVNAGRDPNRQLHLPRPVVDRLNARLDAGEGLAPGDYVDAEAIGSGAFNYFLRLWQREQRAALSAAKRSPGQFHLIRYEDLSADFTGVAQGVFTFFGADPQRTDIGKIAQGTSFRALSGGREAGEESSRSFFRKGIVGDWRNVFSPEQIPPLWELVADAASGFGYTVE